MKMKLMILLGEILTIRAIQAFYANIKWHRFNMLIYAFNPLIILEFTGNLHFEGIMIGCILWSLFYLHKGRHLISAILLALAIVTKLIPLLFLPFIFFYLNWKKGFIYVSVVSLLVLFSMLPFLWDYDLLMKMGSAI